MTFTKTNDKMT